MTTMARPSNIVELITPDIPPAALDILESTRLPVLTLETTLGTDDGLVSGLSRLRLLWESDTRDTAFLLNDDYI